jgi:hypothetical protein
MKKHIYILLIILACSCKVPYQPPVTTTAFNYLVVDGVINSSTNAGDSTLIVLSRTFKISTSPVTNPELHAQVSVEDAANNSFALQDAGKGNYVAGPLGLDGTKQYRLRIKTSDNRVYLSDYVVIKPTPPIDSLGWIAGADKLTIYANAHDATNSTRYYRWEYGETWEFRAKFTSDFVSNGTQIVPRTTAQQYPAQCWQSDQSADIVLASTKQLTQDVLYQLPLAVIPSTSEKISVDYSMLLRQYAVTEEAYTFWQQTKKNTEQLGSIFDALPSQINGNIHCITNPTEPVFGYLSITNIRVKRIFIHAIDLPRWSEIYPYSCSLDEYDFTIQPCCGTADGCPPPPGYASVECNATVQSGLLPFNSEAIPVEKTVNGYGATHRECLDCSIRGTSIKPSFWQ